MRQMTLSDASVGRVGAKSLFMIPIGNIGMSCAGDGRLRGVDGHDRGSKAQRILHRQRSISVLPVLNELANLEATITRLLDALTVTIEEFESSSSMTGRTDDSGGRGAAGGEIPHPGARTHAIWVSLLL